MADLVKQWVEISVAKTPNVQDEAVLVLQPKRYVTSKLPLIDLSLVFSNGAQVEKHQQKKKAARFTTTETVCFSSDAN